MSRHLRRGPPAQVLGPAPSVAGPVPLLLPERGADPGHDLLVAEADRGQHRLLLRRQRLRLRARPAVCALAARVRAEHSVGTCALLGEWRAALTAAPVLARATGAEHSWVAAAIEPHADPDQVAVSRLAAAVTVHAESFDP